MSRVIGCLVPTLAVLALAGCGGSGGAPPERSGWYELSARTGGTTGPFLPNAVVEVEDLGETLWLAGRLYDLRDGEYVSIEPDATAPDRSERRWWVVEEGHLTGLYENFLDGASLGTLDVQLLSSPPPDGRLVLDATLGGEYVSVNSHVAHGLDGVSGGELGLSLQSYPSRQVAVLAFAFTGTPDPGLGTWTVGTVPGTVRVYVSVGSLGGVASDGDVILTTRDGGRAAGSFAVTVEGQPCTGTFDLPVLLHL